MITVFRDLGVRLCHKRGNDRAFLLGFVPFPQCLGQGNRTPLSGRWNHAWWKATDLGTMEFTPFMISSVGGSPGCGVFSALKDDDRLPRLARFEQLFMCLCVSGPDKLSDRT